MKSRSRLMLDKSVAAMLSVIESYNKPDFKYREETFRSGNPMSINLFEAYRIVNEDYGVKIAKAVSDNLIALTEIRDNSIHFVNDDLLLSLRIQELGSASLQNYLHLVSSWFGDVLSRYNFYLMPLSFFRNFSEAPGVSLNSSEKRVLEYIKKQRMPMTASKI